MNEERNWTAELRQLGTEHMKLLSLAARRPT
jgi:hypothetical protein